MSRAYLQITLKIDNPNRIAALQVYDQYKSPFLSTIPGALSKDLLIRQEDIQVLHGFDTAENAAAYLHTELFNKDVVEALKPLLMDSPDVRIYTQSTL